MPLGIPFPETSRFVGNKTITGSLTVGTAGSPATVSTPGSSMAFSITSAGNGTFTFSPGSANVAVLLCLGSDSVRRRALGSSGFEMVASDAVSWSSNANGPSDQNKDLLLARSAAGSLTIGGIGNGQLLGVKQLSELTTIAAAATTDTAIQIPAGALVLGVSVRNTVAVTCTSTYNYGVAGATARYGTSVSKAVNTTYPGTDDGVRFYSAAASIRITPDSTPSDNTGRVRVTIHYLDITPATS